MSAVFKKGLPGEDGEIVEPVKKRKVGKKRRRGRIHSPSSPQYRRYAASLGGSSPHVRLPNGSTPGTSPQPNAHQPLTDRRPAPPTGWP
jgi:hypothetical protein